MKQFVKAAVILVFLFCMVGPAFSQTSDSGKQTKDIYVKTIYVNRVYPYTDGYKVEYMTQSGTLFTTYIPMDWFRKAAGKGEIVFVANHSVPYMEVVYIDNKFDHVRLYVSPSYYDPSWGNSDAPPAEKFKVDTLVLNF